ncbi:MAG: DNA primase [Myxococcaceae bacterium]
MLIPEHKIDEILERVDLTAVVARHVELKKSGRSFKGCCPFHQEKSASFYVTPEMRRYKCFGCQAGGDAISFVQRYLGKSFVDAVKDLAREVGVDLETVEDPTAKERAQLREVTDIAAEHFKSRLWDAELGKGARAYLASRGVTEDVARAFGLGWAPKEWSALADRLRQAGVLEFAVNAGLVQKRQSGDGYYDMFRSRLIIPIRSSEGRTIAFGGRLLEESPEASGENHGPKYLNSRESRLYNKSETLYGMDQAREEIRKKKSAVLVEGYFDCIGMHQAGVKNVVALCSTALTAGHLGVLSRTEAKELILLLDGDKAGRNAVERLAGPLVAAGAVAKVALLPDGEDPDTFARQAGTEGVASLLGGAKALTTYLFESVLPQGRSSSFEEKMAALDRLKPVAAPLPVGLVRSAFFSALASHTGLPAGELELTLRGKTAPQVKAVPKPASPTGSVGGTAPARPERERTPDELESLFVAMALRDARLLTSDVFRVGDELGHTGLRTSLAHITAGRAPEDVLFDASEPVKAALQRANRSLPQDGVGEQLFGTVCRKLKLRRIEEQLTFLAKVTGQTVGANELSEDTLKLMGQRVELLALKKKVLESAQEPRPDGEQSGR